MKDFIHILILFLISLCPLTTLHAGEESESGESMGETEQSALIMIDHDFSDWENISPVARFTSYYNPGHYNREKNGKPEILPIADAAYWDFNGTRLKDVKAVIQNTSLYFYFSTGSPIAEGLSIFLYLYQTRNTEKVNTYTIEITMKVDTGKGKVFLWESEKENVTEIGVTAISPWSIECMISIDLLPQLLGADLISRYSCDLTTCFYEKSTGIYEEFYFTTLFFKDFSAHGGS